MGGDSLAVLAPGLPNIIASQNPNRVSDDGIQGTLDGAFYFKNTTVKGGSAEDANQGVLNGLAFDASRSNPIYGKSTTVQPPSFSLIPQIKY